MSKQRWFARGAGCMGAFGLSGALGVAGTAGLCGVGAWVAYRTVTSQWEATLRDTLAHTTGDEIAFGKLSIGLGGVTVHDLVMRDSLDGSFLEIDALSLRGDPRQLLGAPTAWHLDGLHLKGVALHPQRDGDGFALPATTLALLRGESPLPGGLELPLLVVPEVTVDGLSVVVDGHHVEARTAHMATGATLTPPTGTGSFALTVGTVEVTGLASADPDTRVDRLLVALEGDLTPERTRLALTGVVLEGVSLTLEGLSTAVPRVVAQNEVVLDLAAGPSLTVGTLQSDGFSLTAGNVFHCRDVLARIDQPLTLRDDTIVIDELTATGLRSQTVASGWPALDVLLSATKDASLPALKAPRLTFKGTTIRAKGALASADRTTTSLDFRPGERLAWGPGIVQGFRVTVGDAEQLSAERVEVSGGALTPGMGTLSFDRLGVQGVRGPSRWSGNDFGIDTALLGLADVRGGLVFHTVDVDGIDLDVTGRSGAFPIHIDQVSVGELAVQGDGISMGSASAVGVRLQDGAFGATARAIALAPGATVALHPGQDLTWGALVVKGVSLQGAGNVRLSADHVDVPAGTLAKGVGGLALGPLTVRQLRGSMTWGADAFGVPDAVFRLGGFAGDTSLASVQIEGADVLVHGATGAVPVHANRATLDGFTVGPDGWSMPSATITGVEARADGVRATARTVRLEPDGAVRLEGTEAWARVNDARQLDLPPVAIDHAPVWLGGQFKGKAPFFGVAFPGSPYTPTSVYAPALVLHLTDEGIANPHATWDLPLEVSVGPHDAQGHLPVSVTGEVAGGKLSFEGHIEPAGTVHADVGVRGLVLGDLGMYLDEPMSRFSLQIKQGRGGAAMRMNLEGNQVSMKGTGSGRNLKMQGSALAGVANAGFRAVKGGDNTVSIPIAIEGDLSDPTFSPFDLLLSSYVKGLHRSAAKSLGKAVKGIGGPEKGTVRNKQTGGGRNVDKAFGAIKKALDGGSSDAVRASKPDPEGDAPPARLLDTAADTGRPEAVDTGKE